MSIGRFLLYALVIWLLYNLIFKFIVPIYRTTRRVKKQFGEMKEKMEEKVEEQRRQWEQREGFRTSSKVGQTTPKSSSPKEAGDYIDFEEIK